MLRVRTLFTGVAGSPYYSNLYFGGTGVSNAPGLTTAVRNFWTGVAGFIDDACTIQVDPQVLVLDPATGDVSGAIAGSATATTGASTATPQNTLLQVLVRQYTGRYEGGREIRGHLFIPALTVAVGQTDPSPSAASTISGAASTLRTAALANGTEWGVWSRVNRIIAPVTTAQASQRFSYLRSRRD